MKGEYIDLMTGFVFEKGLGTKCVYECLTFQLQLQNTKLEWMRAIEGKQDNTKNENAKATEENVWHTKRRLINTDTYPSILLLQLIVHFMRICTVSTLLPKLNQSMILILSLAEHGSNGLLKLSYTMRQRSLL